jgi:hypothetical protein
VASLAPKGASGPAADGRSIHSGSLDGRDVAPEHFGDVEVIRDAVLLADWELRQNGAVHGANPSGDPRYGAMR